MCACDSGIAWTQEQYGDMLEEEIGEPLLAQGNAADLDAASRRSSSVLATPLTASASLVRSQPLVFTFSRQQDMYTWQSHAY